MKKYYLILGSLAVFASANAQSQYGKDRVYTANQVSNTVSVIDADSKNLLGEISFGKPQTSVLSPLYRQESLVHGLRFDPTNKILAVVAIGSNSISFVDTNTNLVKKTVYIGRSPHEPTFTPNGKEVWTTVRGESHISVIDMATMEETKKITVSDGPGMICFTPDGSKAFICSSFSPFVDVVDAKTYQVIKKIPVLSPFSPNIFCSNDGKWIAMTHKDMGKVSVIDPEKMEVIKVIETGALTNHVSFCTNNGKLLLPVTVGGENKIKIYDVLSDFKLINEIPVGAIPHGLWPSEDGNQLYIGLEFEDKVQVVDINQNKVIKTIPIGQSPQALVYAENAVNQKENKANLVSLQNKEATIIVLKSIEATAKSKGQLSVRSIGQIDLIEQHFSFLNANSDYTLVLSTSAKGNKSNYEISAFKADAKGKFAGHTTGLIKSRNPQLPVFNHVLVLEKATGKVVLSAEVK